MLEVQPHGRVRSERADDPAPAAKPEVEISRPEDLPTRDQLVVQYLPLVHRLCRRFSNRSEPREDLVQVGTIGLFKAIEKFDHTRGVSFTTYAVPVILGEIKNHLRDHGWSVKVPRKLQRNRLAVHRAVDALGQSLGRSPQVHEISESTGLTQEEVFDTFEAGNYVMPLSLDAEYERNGRSEENTLLDFVGSVDPQFDRTSDKLDLVSVLGSLSERERSIIFLKFYADLSQTEIAKRLGISQMHISRLQRNALSTLRERLAG